MTKVEIKNMNFEEALKELEIIINKLEAGEVPLDDTIVLYERGSELKKFWEKKLKSAEEKIQRISQKQSDSESMKVEDIEK